MRRLWGKIFGRLQSKTEKQKTPEHCHSHESNFYLKKPKQMETEYTEPKAYVNIQAV